MMEGFDWFLEIEEKENQWMILAVGTEAFVRDKFELIKSSQPIKTIRIRNFDLVIDDWDRSKLWESETCECGGRWITIKEGTVHFKVICNQCKKAW